MHTMPRNVEVYICFFNLQDHNCEVLSPIEIACFQPSSFWAHELIYRHMQCIYRHQIFFCSLHSSCIEFSQKWAALSTPEMHHKNLNAKSKNSVSFFIIKSQITCAEKVITTVYRDQKHYIPKKFFLDIQIKLYPMRTI